MGEKNKQIEEELKLLGLAESAGFKNIKSVVEYANNTRKIVRELQQRINMYQNQVTQQANAIELLKKQLQHLQVRLASNRATTN